MPGLYKFGKIMMRFFFLLNGTKVIGADNIPQGRPVVFCANHSCGLDPVLLGGAVPYYLQFIAKKEFFANKFLNYLFTKLGVIPIDRDGNDIIALKRAMSCIKKGGNLAIFPEGTRIRDKNLGDFKGGGVFIAVRCGCDIVPAALVNSRNLFRFWRRDSIAVFGRPIATTGFVGSFDQAVDHYTELVKEEIWQLLLTYDEKRR